MSAFYRCDYCGAECTAGTDVPDHKISISPGAVDKAWRRDHSERRTSRIRVEIGLDGINPEGRHFGHDLCDECIAAHLRTVLAELEA